MSYAVVWSENGGSTCAGELVVGPGGMTLTGASPEGPSRRVLAFPDLARVWVDRRPGSRLNGRLTLVVEGADGVSIKLASVGAAGALLELANRIGTSR